MSGRPPRLSPRDRGSACRPCSTLTIDDHILGEAKAVAARTHRTIGSVFEDALRQMLARSDGTPSPSGAVSLPTDGGSGLQPGVDLENKDQIATLLGDEDPVLLLDANVCVYAFRRESRRHEDFKAWLEQALSGSEPVGLPEQVLASTIRLVTNHRIQDPSTPAAVLSFCDALLEAPAAKRVRPGERHWAIFRDLVSQHGYAAMTSRMLISRPWLSSRAQRGSRRTVGSRAIKVYDAWIL